MAKTPASIIELPSASNTVFGELTQRDTDTTLGEGAVAGYWATRVPTVFEKVDGVLDESNDTKMTFPTGDPGDPLPIPRPRPGP